MSKVNDGGPAFPVDPAFVYNAAAEPTMKGAYGMTLRDYFAAKALQGMLGNSGYHIDGGGKGPDGYGEKSDPVIFSALAYKYADSMLAERSRLEAQP